MDINSLVLDCSAAALVATFWRRYGPHFPLVLQLKVVVEDVRRHRATKEEIAFIMHLSSSEDCSDLDPALVSRIRGRILNIHFRGEHPAYSAYGR